MKTWVLRRSGRRLRRVPSTSLLPSLVSFAVCFLLVLEGTYSVLGADRGSVGVTLSLKIIADAGLGVSQTTLTLRICIKGAWVHQQHQMGATFAMCILKSSTPLLTLFFGHLISQSLPRGWAPTPPLGVSINHSSPYRQGKRGSGELPKVTC